jgi:hypothetical protein
MARNIGICEILRNTDCSTWILARKLKNEENEKQTPYELEYGEKHLKHRKMKIAHCRTCNMARKLTNKEN